ncbi:MAG: phosphoenolpyruvate mutase [Candidatus Omnitrophica bacterium]|nr:phosphoenolpyruvate mutase [Candidatus Omnitrophota bacterium]
MKKSKLLKQLIQSKKIAFLMEAHNGVSAKIAEEAGFKGIWASGLSISAALGVRDNNEASWTQILEVLEFMSDNTRIPILLDGDTGFGNFNNMRRLVRKLEQRHIAGVCIEDKIFPKTNSFISGEQQPLADIEEFCGKIKAGKDAQTDKDFVVVARVEALIAGWGIDEAIKRAKAYAQAGADALLIHSRKSDATEIEGFMKQWDKRKPIVIVPTTYYETPVRNFQRIGVSTIIWANHLLRASVAAMQETAKQIYREQSVKNVQQKIVSVKEVFRLQNTHELKKAEQVYLPQSQEVKAVILAASRGNVGKFTKTKPKCMLEINKKPILSTLVTTMNEYNIKNIHAVVGYKKKVITLPNIELIDNPYYASRNVLYSLYLAKEQFDGPTVVSYGDILFSKHVLQDLLDTTEDIVLTVDTSWIQGAKENREKDVVTCQQSPSYEYLSKNTSSIKKIETLTDSKGAHGEWIGLMKVSSKGASILKKELENLKRKDSRKFYKLNIIDFFAYLLSKKIKITAVYHTGNWLDIDGVEDLVYANKTFKNKRKIIRQ